MMIARWHIQARFGEKQTVIDTLKEWHRNIGAKAGIEPDRVRIVTGSVGEAESAVEVEMQIRDMAELQAFFDKLPDIPGHGDFSKKLEPHMVSGSTYWSVYHVVT